MRHIALILFVAGLATPGCMATYQARRVAGGAGTTSKLESGAGIAVRVPANGRYEHKVYGGSGQATAQALVTAFARHAERVDSINARDCDDAQQKAAAKNYEYLISPTILHWEDRATEWSGIRDKIEVRVQLRDARSGSVVDAVIIAGQSKFASFGGDHPQELLAKPFDRYATSLY